MKKRIAWRHHGLLVNDYLSCARSEAPALLGPFCCTWPQRNGKAQVYVASAGDIVKIGLSGGAEHRITAFGGFAIRRWIGRQVDRADLPILQVRLIIDFCDRAHERALLAAFEPERVTALGREWFCGPNASQLLERISNAISEAA